MSSIPIPPHGKLYDLNIQYESNCLMETTSKANMAVRLGYEVVAINQNVSSVAKETKAKRMKLMLPEPPPLLHLDAESKSYLKINKKNFQQYSRITIELCELGDLHKVRDVLSTGLYDIIAVLPRTDRLFHSACTELHIDIICIDGSEKLPYLPKHATVQAAISRGINFEVCYAPMIRDTTMRRLTINNVQRLVESSKGKNLILSSGALHQMEMRGPYDVANLSTLFGIKENLHIHCVSNNCRSAIVHSFTRKTAKCAVYVQQLNETIATI
uniref:Ribonuclease P protein subunit p30 n=1 Tax=Ciona intestinalis TaxID=7719 RepID=H2XK95_CIOIN|nr:ribonuclease P protein subunit p30-like [Ciona intestinalis]|eukprot:XP_002129371.1 ribonuclease P protein subunit p30-like [Ciona intestinalis]